MAANILVVDDEESIADLIEVTSRMRIITSSSFMTDRIP
jgi:hypothetical protein